MAYPPWNVPWKDRHGRLPQQKTQAKWQELEDSQNNGIQVDTKALVVAQHLLHASCATNRHNYAAAASAMFHLVMNYEPKAMAEVSRMHPKPESECHSSNVLDAHAANIISTAEYLRLKIAETMNERCPTLHTAINKFRLLDPEPKLVKTLNQLNDATTGIKHFDTAQLKEITESTTRALVALQAKVDATRQEKTQSKEPNIEVSKYKGQPCNDESENKGMASIEQIRELNTELKQSFESSVEASNKKMLDNVEASNKKLFENIGIELQTMKAQREADCKKYDEKFEKLFEKQERMDQEMSKTKSLIESFDARSVEH